MGLVRENPVKEEVIEKLLESLRVVVSFASGLAPQPHRLASLSLKHQRLSAAATPGRGRSDRSLEATARSPFNRVFCTLRSAAGCWRGHRP
jgi:hypothetical protein